MVVSLSKDWASVVNVTQVDDAGKVHYIHALHHVPSNEYVFACEQCDTKRLFTEHYGVCTGLNRFFRENNDVKVRLIHDLTGAIAIPVPLFKESRSASIAWTYVDLFIDKPLKNNGLEIMRVHLPPEGVENDIVAVGDIRTTPIWSLRNATLQFLSALYYTMDGCEGRYHGNPMFGTDKSQRKANPHSLETLRQVHQIEWVGECTECLDANFGLDDVK